MKGMQSVRHGRVLLVVGIGSVVLLESAHVAVGQSPPAKVLVAVLEVESRTDRLSGEDLQYVTDAVRKAASDFLDPARYVVMTRENMDIIVPPEERKCMAGMCYAEIGKRLQAKFVVGGNVRHFGNQFGVTLEAYESNTGTVVGMEQGEARDLQGVLALVRNMAPLLLKKVAENHSEAGRLLVNGSPLGARVEVTGPKEFGKGGRLDGSLPFGPMEVPGGVYRIDVSAPGHEPETRTVDVIPGQTASVEVALRMSQGTLEVQGSPEGARVDVSCGKGFSTRFSLPGKVSVPSGSCTISVSKAGYEVVEEAVEVEGGQTTTVSIRLPRVASEERPRDSDSDVWRGFFGQLKRGIEQPSDIQISVVPLEVRVDFSGFPQGPPRLQGIGGISSRGTDKNPHYKRSMRFLKPGAMLQANFLVGGAPDHARLTVVHLSSYSKSCPGDGYSPVTIFVNDRPVVEDHSPPSHGYIQESWDISSLLKARAINTIRFEAGDMCTHYWLQSFSIAEE